jgi:hypothetical protein
MALALIRAYGDGSLLSRLWSEALATPRAGITCPSCRKSMNLVLLEHRIELDLCRHCQSLWFDPEEFDHLPPRTTSSIARRRSGATGALPFLMDGDGPAMVESLGDFVLGLFSS